MVRTRSSRKRRTEDLSDIEQTKRLSIVLEDLNTVRSVISIHDTKSSSTANQQISTCDDSNITNADESIKTKSVSTTSEEKLNDVDSNVMMMEPPENIISSTANPQISNDEATSGIESCENPVEPITNDVECENQKNTDIEHVNDFDLTAAKALRSKNAEYKLVPGPRLNSELLYTTEEKQLYKKNKKNAAGHMGYTCRVDKCDARVYRRPNGEVYYSEHFEGHRHPNAEETQQEMQLKNEIKEDCAKKLDIGSGSHVGTVSEIFHSHVSK